MKWLSLTILLSLFLCPAIAQQSDSAAQQFIKKKCSIARVSLLLDKPGMADYPALFDSIRVKHLWVSNNGHYRGLG